LHEHVKRLAPRLEFHQHINITLAPLVPPDEGAKQAQTAYAKASDLVLMLLQECQKMLFCLYCHLYTTIFRWR
jgi:hypothetical protein